MTTNKFELTEQGKAESLSFAAVARRRALLKGIGKGTALLAATVPLQTLASQSVLTVTVDGQVCSISGAQSGVHSATPSGTPTCLGHNPDRYKLRENFPAPTNPDALITSVFPGCTLTMSPGSPPTLLEVMNMTPSPAEAHWLAAWLNAMGGAPSDWFYPYTGVEIQGFYAANDQNAYTFLTKYMETRP